MTTQTPFDITGKVQPVDPKYCHKAENNLPIRCNYFDGFTTCYAFQEELEVTDDYKMLRSSKCLERERIVALELNGQMRIEDSK